MNEEFNELFDIKDDERDISNLPIPKQNILVHSIIRCVILIVTAVLTLVILFLAALGGEINLAILALAIVIAWFGIMIYEANNLKKKRKDQLAGSNFILVAIALVMILFLTVYISTLI